MGIDGMMGCEVVLVDVMGVHGGIPNVNGPAQLCENRLKELIPPMNVALNVVWIPFVLT